MTTYQTTIEEKRDGKVHLNSEKNDLTGTCTGHRLGRLLNNQNIFRMVIHVEHYILWPIYS